MAQQCRQLDKIQQLDANILHPGCAPGVFVNTDERLARAIQAGHGSVTGRCCRIMVRSAHPQVIIADCYTQDVFICKMKPGQITG